MSGLKAIDITEGYDFISEGCGEFFISSENGNSYYVDASFDLDNNMWSVDFDSVAIACDKDDRTNDIDLDLDRFVNYPDYDNIRDAISDCVMARIKYMEMVRYEPGC